MLWWGPEGPPLSAGMPWFSAAVMVRLDRLIVAKMFLTFLGGRVCVFGWSFL